MINLFRIQLHQKITGYLLASCIVGVTFAEPVGAISIRGTEANLSCVYANRSSLSLDGLVDPVLVYVDGCTEQFSGAAAVDNTHGGVDPPDFQIVPGTPPPDKWTKIPKAEINRIPCKIREVRLSRPNVEIIELDLSTPCEGASE